MQYDKNCRYVPVNGVPVNRDGNRVSHRVSYVPEAVPVQNTQNIVTPGNPDIGYGDDMNNSESNMNGSMSCCNMVLAMAYVKDQPFLNLYEPDMAFRSGTLFKDLDLPYGGKRR